MTSTEVGKKSWGNSEGGYFISAIIEGMDDGKADVNADRSVTAQELFDYVKKTVSSKTNSQQVPQNASEYSAGDGTFVASFDRPRTQLKLVNIFCLAGRS